MGIDKYLDPKLNISLKELISIVDIYLLNVKNNKDLKESSSLYKAPLQNIEKIAELVISFIKMCKLFSNTLVGNRISKQNVVYVYGEPNSMKTSLIGNLILTAVPKSYVGSITFNSQFPFQSLVGKKVLLNDEWSYLREHNPALLKLFEGERVQVAVKSKDDAMIQINTSIICSNLKEIGPLDLMIALKTRVLPIQFYTRTDLKVSEIINIREFVSNNGPLILVQCNRLTFSILRDTPSRKFEKKSVVIKSLIDDSKKLL
jgi:hypothetical protein